MSKLYTIKIKGQPAKKGYQLADYEQDPNLLIRAAFLRGEALHFKGINDTNLFINTRYIELIQEQVDEG